MKTCPYCAEEIQDAAIKCRYCQSWLVDEVPAGADTPPAGLKDAGPEPEPTPEPEPAQDVEPAPVEPAPVEPAPTEPAPTEPAPTEPAPAPSSTTAPATAAPAAAAPAQPELKVEFTHSGERYLLGYTDEFFGVWDRQAPTAPMERFPRTDDGWRQAWQRYAAIESNWMDLRTGQRST